ncbi:hypothetical protein [Pseudomonas viridiflava]|nr:hypothetical protein [Pseudomonas viridiflava]
MNKNSELARRIAFKNLKHGFETGDTIALLSFIHSVLGTISFAFLLALFSLGGNIDKYTIILKMSILLFSIGLAGNVIVFGFISFTKNNREVVWIAQQSYIYTSLTWVAYLSPFAGTFMLVNFHSQVSAIAFIFTTMIFLAGMVYQFRHLKNFDHKIHRKIISAIESDDLPTLQALRAWDFKDEISAGRDTPNKHAYTIRFKETEKEVMTTKAISFKNTVFVGDNIYINDNSKKALTISKIIHTPSKTILECVFEESGH